tara:strand:+ start:5163 stop:6230 length:1068 start_codon:yes stop_codon:yes gene_type:complete
MTEVDENRSTLRAVSFIDNDKVVVGAEPCDEASSLHFVATVTYLDDRAKSFSLVLSSDEKLQAEVSNISASLCQVHTVSLDVIKAQGIPKAIEISTEESVRLEFFEPRFHLSTLCCETVDEAKETLWFGSSPLRQNSNQSTRFIAEQSLLNDKGAIPVRVNAFVIYCYKLAECAAQSPFKLGTIADELLASAQELEFANASKLDRDCLTGSLITAYWHYLLSLGDEEQALQVASKVLGYEWQTPYHHFGLNVAVSTLLLALNAYKDGDKAQLESYFKMLKAIFDKLASKSISNPEWFQDLGGIHRITLAIWRLHEHLQYQKTYSEWFLKDTVRKSFRVKDEAFFKRVEALYGKPV